MFPVGLLPAWKMQYDLAESTPASMLAGVATSLSNSSELLMAVVLRPRPDCTIGSVTSEWKRSDTGVKPLLVGCCCAFLTGTLSVVANLIAVVETHQ